MKIVIRRAVYADAEEMALVETKAHWNDSSITKPQEFRRESYVKLLSGGEDIFVLTADEQIAAVCIVLDCEDEDYSGYADIVEISVLPEMWNLGFARKLVSHTLDESRKKGFKNAYARCLGGTDNSFEEPITRLFTGLGFDVRKSSPDHDGIYEIIFTRVL
ncbi:MAG: GNAT family N-acetyltransferase [Oscillospiraceae bacterium]|nr:GNAT family N-acetyltransferase [Oscillospiraceae bacterium]